MRFLLSNIPALPIYFACQVDFTSILISQPLSTFPNFPNIFYMKTKLQKHKSQLGLGAIALLLKH